jgi:RND family efflux transporter MFP subunit
MKSENGSLNGNLNGNANGNGNSAWIELRELSGRPELDQDTNLDVTAMLDAEEAHVFAREDAAESQAPKQATPHKRHFGAVAGAAVLIGLALGAAYFGSGEVPAIQSLISATHATAPAAPVPAVVVSTPLVKDVEPQLQFLGQFSAVDRVEIRAQVGGTLTSINFKDGDIVKQGTVLFTIDPTPYSIKLAQAQAQVEAAQARIALANTELARAKSLVQTGAFSTEEVERRSSEQLSAQAALDDAQAAVRDAQFDLDHCQISAPFSGKIGSHQVSVGNLVAGSRAATSPTTLLATIVSIDPIWVNFDMSESDYLTFLHARAKQTGPLADKVVIALGDENSFTREGILDFIDNSLDRSSGTIHARATIPNKDFVLTPGGFARIRVTLGAAEPALLVPDASIFNDQSNHIVMTVDANNVVVPKVVELGDIRDGLRVIRSGLSATDRVITSGAILAKPGTKVSTTNEAIQPKSDQVADLTQ